MMAAGGAARTGARFQVKVTALPFHLNEGDDDDGSRRRRKACCRCIRLQRVAAG